MKKIKISTITILVCYVMAYAFLPVIPVWLGLLMTAVSLVMFIWLNIEAFKTKGIINKLVKWSDAVWGLIILLALIPQEFSIYLVASYLVNALLPAFAGLLVAILVNAYKTERV